MTLSRDSFSRSDIKLKAKIRRQQSIRSYWSSTDSLLLWELPHRRSRSWIIAKFIWIEHKYIKKRETNPIIDKKLRKYAHISNSLTLKYEGFALKIINFSTTHKKWNDIKCNINRTYQTELRHLVAQSRANSWVIYGSYKLLIH